MAKPAARILLLQGLLAVAGVVVVGRSAMVQLVQHSQWKARADQRRVVRPIPARRGTIYDRNGVVLASTEERFRLSITVGDLRDTAGLVARLPRLLNISPERVRKAFETDYAWFQGPFTADQIDSIRNLRGVHPVVVYRRVYPQDSVGLAIVGTLNDDGTAGASGLEASLDTLLRGSPGVERAWRDANGKVLESPGTVVRDPVAGNAVYLTIDRDLQAIAESELLRTVQQYRAHGGDFVIYEVGTGEILAAASFSLDTVTGRLRRSATAITGQYEPGSTSKLFTAAAILKSGSDTTPVSGEGGVWRQHVSDRFIRTITDVHKVSGMLGLGDAIKFSSNIAMSKFSLKLKPEDQFETLRDFGFGAPLALNFPSEASGELFRPAVWDNPMLARPSIATGYYFHVSTAHLAVAYGAIANHGVLLAPTLVREVRTAGNGVLFRHQPLELRRAIPDSVARHLLEYLARVTDSGGTGLEAQLDDGGVAGKTGTAVVNCRRQCGARQYRSSFAGVYPGDNPQIAFTVMVDRPQGVYYGGRVAAPIIRSSLQSALALLASPIDRKRPAVVPQPAAIQVVATETARDHPVPFPLAAPPPADTAMVPVPDLAGSSIRDATFALHQRGFEVKLVGRGKVRATIPAAGDSLPRGASVTIRADSLR